MIQVAKRSLGLKQIKVNIIGQKKEIINTLTNNTPSITFFSINNIALTSLITLLFQKIIIKDLLPWLITQFSILI